MISKLLEYKYPIIKCEKRSLNIFNNYIKYSILNNQFGLSTTITGALFEIKTA